MSTHAQKYRQLLSLTQSYLLDEFTSKDWILTDEESYNFFKKFHHSAEHKKPVPSVPPSTVRPAAAIQQNPKIQQAPPPPPIRQEKVTQPPSAPVAHSPAQTPSKENPPPSKANPKPSALALEPLDAAPKFDYEKICTSFRELFPNLPVIEQIPDDTEAKKIGNRWKKETFEPEIVILSFNEPVQSKAFLKNMAQAIHLHLGPTAIYPAHAIEQKDKWEQLLAMKKLKLVITTDFGMYSLPKLMRFYKESSNKSFKYLGDIPVLLITDPVVYFKQPNLKHSLWRALTSLLQSPK